MKFWLSKEESKRLRQIARVLWDNQMGLLLRKLRISKLPLDKKFKTDRFRQFKMSPETVRKVFEQLDGSFIKLGQLLSLRPDLIPAPYCDELAKLQDKVPSFSGKKAREIVQKELGGKVFKTFDEKPIAAASMGQVHIATLRDGTKVAVKVQRPDIEKTVKTDIKLLYRLATAVTKRYGSEQVDAVAIVREFERYTQNEMNYLKEAHNIDLFHANFDKTKTIIVPKVYWKYTTSRVITLEYIPGMSLSDLSKLKPEQKKKVVDTILQAEYEQIFEYGFFHADPHPGNYILKRNGQIALLDYGIVGRMDYALRENVTDLFVSIINADVEGIVDAAANMGVVGEEVQMRSVRDDIREELGQFYGVEISKIEVSKVLHGVIHIFKKNGLTISPNFVLLAKATITLEGVTKHLDPKFNLAQRSKPYVRKLVRQRMHPKKIASRAKHKIDTMISFAESIPRKTSAFLSELQDTDRDLRRIDKDISQLSREIDRSSNRVTLGFLAGTLFIASTILLPYQTYKLFGMPSLSFIGYIVALAVTIMILISMLKEMR